MKSVCDKQVVSERAICVVLHIPKIHPMRAVVHGHQPQLSIQREVRWGEVMPGATGFWGNDHNLCFWQPPRQLLQQPVGDVENVF